MAVKEGDFIRLEYTGKVQETGDVFDTTDENVAEEAGIKLDNKSYGAIPIVVGGGHVLKGLDEALIGMEEAEEKTVEIAPEEGFGLRDPKLLQLIPMGEFRETGNETGSWYGNHIRRGNWNNKKCKRRKSQGRL